MFTRRATIMHVVLQIIFIGIALGWAIFAILHILRSLTEKE